MFFYIEGILKSKEEEWIVLENNGFGFRIVLNKPSLENLPKEGEKVKVFTYFYQKENQPLQIFGFLTELEVRLFEFLNSVSGIGPRTALSILNQASPEEIVWAIKEGRSDFLEKVSGIGKKTAQRIILELKEKIKLPIEEKSGGKIDEEMEILEILSSLGFSKTRAKEAIKEINPGVKGIENKLKEALKILGKEKI